MNKKLLSLALSGFLAVSAAFGLAACKSQENGELNGGTNGGNGNSDNNSSTNTVKPGTVITDEKIKESVFSGLSKAELSGLTYSGGVSFSLSDGAENTVQKLSLGGALRFDEFAGDVELSLENEEGLSYFLGFLREDGLYSLAGEAEGDEADFAALKEGLKKKEGGLVLEKSEAGLVQTVFAAPATVKILKNMTALFGGVVTKTEGGYSLSYDLIEGAGALLAGVSEVAEAIEKTAAMTLTGLFTQKFTDDALTKLLQGVTAKELAAFFPLLPEEVRENLPEPAGETAKEYLVGLLRSGSFYTALTGEGEPWTNYHTFGEVPLSELVSFLTDGEVDLATLGLKEKLADLIENKEKEIVALLLRELAVEGEVSEEIADLSVEFSFDDDYKLLGISLDSLFGGTVSAQQTEQPDGGKTPEDGGGDPMETAGEGAAQVRVTCKMSAVCTQSPELFDLEGCRYQGADGPVTIG